MKHLLKVTYFIVAFMLAVLITKTVGIVRTKETAKALRTISYCDLIKNPGAFDRQLLNVSGEIWRGSNGLYLSDSKCEPENSNTTLLEFDRLWASTQAWQLDMALMEVNWNDVRPYKIKRVNATVTGHFDAYRSPGCWGEPRYRLVITDAKQTSEIKVDNNQYTE